MSEANRDITVAPGRRKAVHERRVLRAFALVCFGLYTPFAWLLQLDFTTNAYHFHWLCMWPILPGLVAGMPLKRDYDDLGLLVGSGIATVVLLFILTCVGVRARLGLLFAVAAGLVISIPTSIVSYWLFRH